MFRLLYRKIQVAFRPSEILLTALAFELAYVLDARLELELHIFFLTLPMRIQQMGKLWPDQQIQTLASILAKEAELINKASAALEK